MYIPKACGFVLTRTGAKGLEYLLLMNRKRQEPGFPKGHVEAKETELETARRETEEETALTDYEVHPHYRYEMTYAARRKGKLWNKTVVYFSAHLRHGTVRLSREHSAYDWLPLDQAIEALPHENARRLLLDFALFHKDPVLFRLYPPNRALAATWIEDQPDMTDRLSAHLHQVAGLTERIARALADAGVPIHVEGATVAALLHDAGRAIGRHKDHPAAGTELVRADATLAPYGVACISHFTKGASSDELRAAGVKKKQVAAFERLIDMRTLTWEECCVALSDACVKGADPIGPTERFKELKTRYDTHAIIDLQAQKTEAIRARLETALGRDPLGLLPLDN